MVLAADRARLAVPSSREITDLVADAYAAAARAGASMPHAVEVLEAVRASAATVPNGYELLRALDDAVLKAVGNPLLRPTQRLRDRCRDLLVRTAAQTALTGTDGDPGQEWLRTFGDALCHYSLEVCAGLIVEAERSELTVPLLVELRAAVTDARADDWGPFGPLIERLLALDLWDDPERVRLTATAALCHLFFREDRIRARELATTMHRSHPELPQTVEALAFVELVDGRRGQAEDLLRPLVEAGSLHDGIHSAYADCASWEDENELAEERLLTGLRLRPASAEILNRLIDLYSAPGFFAERRDRQPILVAQVVAVDPDSTYRAQLALGRGLRQAGELVPAEQVLRQLIDSDPGRLAGYLELARLQLAAEDLPACRATLDAAASRTPRSAELAEVQAQCAEAARDLPAAVEWSRRAVEWSHQLSVWAWVNLAMRELEAGEEESSFDSALAALRSAPYDTRIATMLTEVFAARWRAGHEEEVAEAYDSLSAAGSPLTPAQVQSALATVAIAAEDDTMGIVHLQLAVQHDPGDPAHRRSLADVLRRRSRWEEALEAYEAAFQLDGDRAAHDADVSRTLNERGNEAVSASRFEDAAEDYEAAIALGPDEPVFHSNLALALDLTDRPNHRAELLERVVAALSEAHRLAPKGDYGVQLARASDKLRRVQRFGELVEKPTLRKPIVVEAAQDLVPLLDPAQRGAAVFAETIPGMRTALRATVGFEFPSLTLMGAALPDHHYRIRFDGALYAAGTAYDGYVWVEGSLDDLRAAGDLIEGVDPVTGGPGAWVRDEHVGSLGAGVGAPLDPVTAIFRHVADQLRRHAARFFTLDVASAWVDEHSADPVESGRAATIERKGVALRERRQLATARALRGYLLRSGALDEEALRAVEGALDAVDKPERANPLRWAAAALARIPDGSSGQELVESVDVPSWVDTALADGRCLTPAEEHRLLRDLRPETDVARRLGRPLTLVTPQVAGSEYLRRLVTDGLDSPPGVRVSVRVSVRATSSPTQEGPV